MGGRREVGRKKERQKYRKKLLEVIDIFSTLLVVMRSQIYAYIQDIYFKYVQFLYISYTSLKLKV